MTAKRLLNPALNSWSVAGQILTIVLPYPGAERSTPIWAAAETEIAFRRQPRLACRCTLAFAAMELQRFLVRTVEGITIRFASKPPRAGFALILEATTPASRSDDFALIPEGTERLRIRGGGRTGTLLGSYEFLKLQGWRWYAPGAAGEIAPEATGFLRAPAASLEERPALDAGGGFDLEYYSMESADLLLWSARNGLNVWAGRSATFPLACKLGMTVKAGGHIFESILHPDAVLPDGRALWDAHQEWFGLPADGPRIRDSAQRTQFCVSQPELIEFLGAALLKRLQKDWSIADRLDIWGFDTWGHTCQCPACRDLGNPTDVLLAFASRIREFLNQAEADARLDRHVTLILCAYEGTASLDGPSRPVPQNLAADGTLVTFYPINRCYRHPLGDRDCATNRRYWEALKSWTEARPALRIVMGEYYNVSKFEDLPLLFTGIMQRDWPSYVAAGVKGATYMHIPTVEWGMRALTQNLYARLTRKPAAPVDKWTAEYFDLWYGAHSSAMEECYELTENTGRLCAQWRAWADWSVLCQMQAWDGTPAVGPLLLHEHLGTMPEAVAAGRKALANLRKALDLVMVARQREKLAATENDLSHGRAINPAELLRMQSGARVLKHLSEDMRLLRYGLDVQELSVDLMAYHEALRHRLTGEAASLWTGIEAAAERLEQYVVPLGFAHNGPGLSIRDGLERSQLGPVVQRCRSFRMHAEGFHR
ncbi:MAG: DUF4838 domain-containing protein [Verrucomicrobiae bacterium]